MATPRALKQSSTVTTVAVFGGPWETGYRAQDGAVYGFADIERALRHAIGAHADYRIIALDIADFLSDRLTPLLEKTNIVFANCGPMTALLFHLRENLNLKFIIYREVRTLGWIGYAFQEYVAHELSRPGDLCLHVSDYCAQLWKGVRHDIGDRMFYPSLREERKTPSQPKNKTLRCGYFSRICTDKGFGYLPAIVEKLIAANWPISELVVCGALEEPELLEHGRQELSVAGVKIHNLGELDYEATREAIASVDVVLFPSLSSYEAAGRVVVEAYNLGKRVIASDYCLAADAITDTFRIPLTQDKPTTGSSALAFPVAVLSIDQWRAPAWEAENFVSMVCEKYRYRSADIKRLLAAAGSATELSQQARNLTMQFDWGGCDNLSAMASCERVRGALTKEYRNRSDLLDLGGAFKRSLLGAGFEPTVTFQLNPAPQDPTVAVGATHWP